MLLADWIVQYTEDTQSLQSKIEALQKALQTSEAQLKVTEKKLKGGREDHDAEMDAFMNVCRVFTTSELRKSAILSVFVSAVQEAIQMANERIERETAARDTKIAALEAEVK
jgi:hypothetical protein